MSTTTRSSAEADTRVGDRPVVRWLLGAGGAAFWGWLGFRWLIDWGVVRGVEGPLIDPAVVRPISPTAATAVKTLPVLADAAWLTVVLTVVSIALGFVIAVPASVARVYGDRSATVSLIFTELIRGTPLLAQLFVLYYAFNLSQYFRGVSAGLLPEPAVYVAVIGFTINSAAYQAEYIRSALLSVGAEQLVAARAVGLSKLASIRYVVLPQALRFAIPGWSNELVYLIKYSSLAAFITVPELFKTANGVAAETFQYTRIFTLVALMYLGLVISASKLMSSVEDRTAIPGLGSDAGR